MEGILEGDTHDGYNLSSYAQKRKRHAGFEETDELDTEDYEGGGEDGEMMMTLSRAAEKADRAEKKRKKEEKKIKRASRAAGRGGVSLSGRVNLEDEGEVDELQVDPALLPPATKSKVPGSGAPAAPVEESSSFDRPQKKKRKTKSNAHAEAPSSTQAGTSSKATATRTATTATATAPGLATSKQPAAAPSLSVSSAAMNNLFRATKNAKPDSKRAGIDIDVLRGEFKVAGAMNAFLSEKWLSTLQLRALEEQGILQYKKGRFSDEEETAVRQHLSHFQKANRLTDTQLADLIMEKGRKSSYPRFWYDCDRAEESAASLPGRPMRFVQKYVRRLYNPLARKGKWTPEEDQALMQAYNKTPNMWTIIAESVDRAEEDCRSRWRDNLRGDDNQILGKWTKEDEQELEGFIRQANIAAGKGEFARDAPWEAVVGLMGGKRSAPQCRKKWHDKLLPLLLGEDLYANGIAHAARKKAAAAAAQAAEAAKPKLETRMSAEDAVGLVALLQDEELEVESAGEIDWDDIASEYYPGYAPEALKKALQATMARAKADPDLPLDEALAICAAYQAKRKKRQGKGKGKATETEVEEKEEAEEEEAVSTPQKKKSKRKGKGKGKGKASPIKSPARVPDSEEGSELGIEDLDGEREDDEDEDVELELDA